MVLTYDAYSETLEYEKQEKDRLTIIEQEMAAMRQAQKEFGQLLKDPNKLLSILKKE
jgi:hypothetical protein